MVPFGYLLLAIGQLLGAIINIYIILMIAHAILSWVSPDPRNVIVQFITAATEPILYRVRSKIPPIGMLDLSVIIVILGLYFLDTALVNTILYYAQICLGSGTKVIGV